MSFRSLVTDLLGGGIPVQRATTTLTDAQIKALPTTPITLIAAPGAGYRIKQLSWSLRMIATAGAYTNLNATYAALQATYAGDSSWLVEPVVRDTSMTVDLTDLATFLGATDLTYDGGANSNGKDGGATDGTTEYNVGTVLSTTASENKAVQISMDNNGSGNLTGGNAANTLRVTFYYVIEATA